MIGHRGAFRPTGTNYTQIMIGHMGAFRPTGTNYTQGTQLSYSHMHRTIKSISDKENVISQSKYRRG